jgi:hypothetical protein
MRKWEKSIYRAVIGVAVSAVVLAVMLTAGTALANEDCIFWKKSLGVCTKELSVCTTKLLGCSANLCGCKMKLNICTENLEVAQDELQTCEEDLQAYQSTARLPKTGQTYSLAPGDDGALQLGVPWPNPRFTNNGNGSVTDNLTGLVWLQNANCFGDKEWGNALAAANGLKDGDCGLNDGSVAGDWRMPNVRELYSLINYKFFNPALSNAAGTAQWTEGDPFSNVWNPLYYGYYWSSTELTYSSAVMVVAMQLGEVTWMPAQESVMLPVWPVRGGQ